MTKKTPTDIARMSYNQAQGPTAMATMGYFEANAMFSTTHGTEFELGESRDLKIKNADEAKLTTWTTNGSKGETVKGAWVFVSSGADGAAGLEIAATTLSDKEIEKIIDSVEFNPDEYDRSAEPHESTTANQIRTTQRLLQTSKTTARTRFPMR